MEKKVTYWSTVESCGFPLSEICLRKPCVQLQLRLISKEKVSSKWKGYNLFACLGCPGHTCINVRLPLHATNGKWVWNTSSQFFPEQTRGSVRTICLKKTKPHGLCQVCEIWRWIQTLGERTRMCRSSDGTFSKCVEWLTLTKIGGCNLLVTLVALQDACRGNQKAVSAEGAASVCQ